MFKFKDRFFHFPNFLEISKTQKKSALKNLFLYNQRNTKILIKYLPKSV